MNPDNPSLPPIIPSTVPAAGPADESAAPITGFGSSLDALLRTPERITWHLKNVGSSGLVPRLALLALLGSAAYGLVVGSFAGGQQFLIAPAKIVGGLVTSALICLPSLFIFSAMNGARARLADVAGLLVSFLALATLLLIGFAPVAWIFSVSTESASFMGSLHLGFWLIGTLFGLRFLSNGLQKFGLRPGGPAMLVWGGIFLAVGLQMTCALRPIVSGNGPFFPGKKMFFLNYWSQCLDEKSPDVPSHD